MACGSEYWLNGSSNCSLRASTIGSVGGANGSRAMTRQLSASPTTSTPSQKLLVPSSTHGPALERLQQSGSRAAVDALAEQDDLARVQRVAQDAGTSARSWLCEVNSTIVLPLSSVATSRIIRSTAVW